MNRGSFLKSALALIAAPSILKDIKFKEPDTPKYRFFYYKITKEMQYDLPRMKWLLEENNSDFHIKARQHGIDFNKPIEGIETGWIEDDFITGALTMRIKQKI